MTDNSVHEPGKFQRLSLLENSTARIDPNSPRVSYELGIWFSVQSRVVGPFLRALLTLLYGIGDLTHI